MGAGVEEIERLYRERYLGFRNGLAAVTGSDEVAREVVQEAFVRALAQREQFRGEGSLVGWVWRIALRLALQAAARPSVTSLNGLVDPVLPEPERDPVLAEALRALPPRRRLLVFLRYFADLSYSEIAAVTGLSGGTVAAALAQAHAALRGVLEEAEVAERAADWHGAQDG